MQTNINASEMNVQFGISWIFDEANKNINKLACHRNFEHMDFAAGRDRGRDVIEDNCE